MTSASDNYYCKSSLGETIRNDILQEQLWLCICDRLLLSVMRTFLFSLFFVLFVFCFVCQAVGLVHQSFTCLETDE